MSSRTCLAWMKFHFAGKLLVIRLKLTNAKYHKNDRFKEEHPHRSCKKEDDAEHFEIDSSHDDCHDCHQNCRYDED